MSASTSTDAAAADAAAAAAVAEFGGVEGDAQLSQLQKLMEQFSMSGDYDGDAAAAEPTREPLLESFDLEGVARYIEEHDVHNVIVMVGAGLSCAAGIPDFRSPGTGLYANLEKYNLPQPEAIFTLSYFKQHPEAFFTLAKELWPGNYQPSVAHYFLRHLHETGRLLRCYTQNIDGLECVAGLPEDRCFAAHGTFQTAHCVACGRAHDSADVQRHVFEGTVPRCQKKASCRGVVKPDIVFFGESLPPQFDRLVNKDFPRCDLLVVLGTSLKVYPFASLVEFVDDDVPRVLINNEKLGDDFVFDGPGRYRDVYVGGDLQEACVKFATLLGEEDAFRALATAESHQFQRYQLEGQASRPLQTLLEEEEEAWAALLASAPAPSPRHADGDAPHEADSPHVGSSDEVVEEEEEEDGLL